MGPGYEGAPRFRAESTASDVDDLAAEHRLLCYKRYAKDLPEDGGQPTLTPQVTVRRRNSLLPSADAVWLEDLIKYGRLSVNDLVPFSTHVQVAKLFGHNFKGHQRATIRLDDTTEVWFPKMYENKDWANTISPSGDTITMVPVLGGEYADVMESKQLREYVFTFGHMKSRPGPNYYAFLGVFKGESEFSDNTKWVHRRVADTIHFDGNGWFSFEPTIVRGVLNDQLAEAAAADPKLTAAIQRDFDNGVYRVEDQTGTTKVRGSAQRVFSKAVKSNYGGECAVTGIRTPAFLVASHIVPWSDDKKIRTDPTNGICLSTFVDRAFDSGFLEITPNGRTLVRWGKVKNDPILKAELRKIDDVEIAKPAVSEPDPAKLARRIELGY
ncbi:HNH endonuclease [Salinibacterium sp. UTAS2018]|nr:HNH endonuclease [Salinibacterium sp. UTAS2018]